MFERNSFQNLGTKTERVLPFMKNRRSEEQNVREKRMSEEGVVVATQGLRMTGKRKRH